MASSKSSRGKNTAAKQQKPEAPAPGATGDKTPVDPEVTEAKETAGAPKGVEAQEPTPGDSKQEVPDAGESKAEETAEETAIENTAGAEQDSKPVDAREVLAGAVPLEDPVTEGEKAAVGDAPQGAVETPASAQLDAPPPRPTGDAQRPGDPESADAAVEAMQKRPTKPVLRTADGEKLDAGAVFGEPNSVGRRVCKVRIIEHSTITAYQRPIERLLLPKGRNVSEATARQVIAQIENE